MLRVYSAAVALLLAVVLAAFPGGCSKDKDRHRQTVVVYTCLDQIHSEPVLAEFERRTGIAVRPKYDAEAAKTVGLINLLIAEGDKPQCDVLWNNEILHTERLAQRGLLAKYVSPAAERFPAEFRDPQGRWTGFAGRIRVIIYNKKLVAADQVPVGLSDLTSSRWRGRAAIARPYFGTTQTHAAILYQRWGPQRLLDYLNALRANHVALAAGNGPVRDMVARGDRAFGLTDTDDAYAAILDGKGVGIAIPDPDDGAVLIPNTVALIANCPHPEAAKKLIDYLLSPEVERRLAAGRSAQIPLATDLADVKTPWDDLPGRRKVMPVDIHKAAAAIDEVNDLLDRARMDQ